MEANTRRKLIRRCERLIRWAFRRNLIPPWYTMAEALREIASALERG